LPAGRTHRRKRRAIASFAIARLGHRHDLKNVVDLARYLLPTPPVPTRFRRRMIAFGSGDPTHAICSTLIVQAFQAVHYPVLPTVEYRTAATEDCPGCVDEVVHIRHHSPVRSPRLRCFALFSHHQTNDRRRIRFQNTEMELKDSRSDVEPMFPIQDLFADNSLSN
jgi:hypothetical protein